jgi:NAD(P)-dependent dehydrogenase (short-subunit alcohol dehydrogenase family)
MGLLDGLRVLVTGGASGIGEATVRRMAAEGAAVAVVDRDGDGAHRVAGAVGGVGLEADVADPAAMAAAADEAVGALGGLGAAFLNAGVGNLKRLHTYTEAEWDRVVDVNLKGTFNGLRAVLPHLVAAGGGSVVTMASVSGVCPTRGEGPYAAAKAGVIALTRSAALEYGPSGVRVNCVSPGFIRTPLTEFAFADPELVGPLEAATPLRRAGTAEEVADVVVFLCSHLARYVTGQNLLVDGGSILPNAQVDPLLRRLLGEEGA